MAKQTIYRPVVASLAGLLILAGLYLSSLYQYLLFHTLAELFSIVVACGIFMFAWNSRQFLDNKYLFFMGLTFIFVAGLDLVHTLAYEGMPIFVGYGGNLPTQLWIAARYLQSISWVIAPLFFYRTIRLWPVLAIYTLVFGLLLAAIFGGIFPACYIEGVGLTPFKKWSEIVISLLLAGAVGLLVQHRRRFDENIFRWLFGAMIVTIMAELAFIFYVGVYDFSNLIGHFLKIIAFYLIYKAIIETGLVKPYSVLFRNLKQSEERLRQYTVELQTRNEELDAYAHTVAHDLKNPISNLIVCSNLLRDDITAPLNDEQRDMLQSIEEISFKMNSIIDSLLVLAEVRQVEVQAEPLPMERIIAEAKRRLANMIEEYRGEIILPTTWPTAFGYAPWIEEVWVNYLSNALKYGGRPPRVEIGAAVQPDNRVRFWVRDNGPGLTTEEQARLFHSFIRLKSRRVAGYGLGLSIVKRIVERLNGQVGVESTGQGRGSEFFFTLPGDISLKSI